MVSDKKPRKARIGFFSFTCDEGCMITFLEILNTKFFEWAEKVDIVYCRQLKKKGEIRDLDIAFVEGAISSVKDRRRIMEVRANSNILVVMGSCAIAGAPSNQRNFFDEHKREEIAFLLQRFQQLPQVSPVKETVKVDYEIPGCPIIEDKFIEVMTTALERAKEGSHAQKH